MSSFEDILDLVTSPGRYLPLEMFAYQKDLAQARVKVALAFPDTYEVGMSHLGVRILYHLLNEQDGIACDRAYAPWADLEALLRERKILLPGHESGAPLKDFDVLGFSLTYELCYTNVLNMLDLAGIPLLASERGAGRWPLIIGGGPCASNPEPVAPFFDAFLFGDGEEAVIEICRAVAEWKDSGAGKDDLLDRLARIEGVYVPSFFEPEYDETGRIRSVRALKKGYDRVRRRIVADLETAYFPERPLVPLLEPVHDRALIEIARGCARGCRFCHAGIINRPVRERSSRRVIELARISLGATGYEECSLLALSAGDYSGISELLTALIREHYGSRVSVSLPSLRVQGLSDAMLTAIESVRKTGFTLAPEAGTERLRRVINKEYTEDELIETARRVFGHGWRTLKLYFMIGLPTETDADIEGILALVDKVARIRGAQGRPQVTVSLSGFVPKPHTPFQWEPQIGAERLREAQERVKAGFAGRGRKVKWQDARVTELEGVMSRGDRRVAPAILAAFRRGQRFDGWSERFDYEGWQKAFADAGVDPAFYDARAREKDEVFPWDHLDPGVTREWLWEERERAYREELTPDCREAGCIHPCGVCDETIKHREAERIEESAPAGPAVERGKEPDVFFRYRVRYARRGRMRFMSQLEVTRLFSRAVRRAKLPVRYSQGFHPQPRIMFGPSPPVGVASEAEFVDLELVRRVPPEDAAAALSGAVPPGIAILELYEVPMKAAPVSAIITAFDYVVKRPAGAPAFDAEAIRRFLEKETMVITQKREKGDREVDLRSRVKYLEIGDEGELRIGVLVPAGPGVKPQEVVASVFGMADDEVKGLTIVRTGARFKEARPVRFAGRGERVRREKRGAGGQR
ncbi:MAG TPA: TIGR03960 family B12-binding radical SAM protein [bacterium]|nr:TIGR03960 family B12-binding radical SAM protein [bacterium]